MTPERGGVPSLSPVSWGVLRVSLGALFPGLLVSADREAHGGSIRQVQSPRLFGVGCLRKACPTRAGGRLPPQPDKRFFGPESRASKSPPSKEPRPPGLSHSRLVTEAGPCPGPCWPAASLFTGALPSLPVLLCSSALQGWRTFVSERKSEANLSGRRPPPALPRGLPSAPAVALGSRLRRNEEFLSAAACFSPEGRRLPSLS